MIWLWLIDKAIPRISPTVRVMDETSLRARLPDLFTPVRWGAVEAVFAPSEAEPPPALLAT